VVQKIVVVQGVMVVVEVRDGIDIFFKDLLSEKSPSRALFFLFECIQATHKKYLTSLFESDSKKPVM
jgi:hypothetical protein